MPRSLNLVYAAEAITMSKQVLKALGIAGVLGVVVFSQQPLAGQQVVVPAGVLSDAEVLRSARPRLVLMDGVPVHEV